MLSDIVEGLLGGWKDKIWWELWQNVAKFQKPLSSRKVTHTERKKKEEKNLDYIIVGTSNNFSRYKTRAFFEKSNSIV